MGQFRSFFSGFFFSCSRFFFFLLSLCLCLFFLLTKQWSPSPSLLIWTEASSLPHSLDQPPSSSSLPFSSRTWSITTLTSSCSSFSQKRSPSSSRLSLISQQPPFVQLPFSCSTSASPSFLLGFSELLSLLWNHQRSPSPFSQSPCCGLECVLPALLCFCSTSAISVGAVLLLPRLGFITAAVCPCPYTRQTACTSKPGPRQLLLLRPCCSFFLAVFFLLLCCRCKSPASPLLPFQVEFS